MYPAPPALADGRGMWFSFLGSVMNGGGRISLPRPGLLSKPRETSQALCCSSHVFLPRYTSEIKLDGGKHVSFSLSFPGNYMLLLKLCCLNLCWGFPSGDAPVSFYET